MKRVKFDETPDAGSYDPHKEFGSDLNNTIMGGPYVHDKSDTPGPGTYDADISLDRIKPNTRSASINE